MPDRAVRDQRCRAERAWLLKHRLYRARWTACSSSPWSRRWQRPTAHPASPTPAHAWSRSSGRRAISRAATTRSARGQSSYFVWLNRGKESIALDIKTTGGQGACWRGWLARADVFIQNLAPGRHGPRGLRQRRPAREAPAPHHRGHLRLRRGRRVRRHEGLRPAGAGGKRAGFRHRPAGGAGPRRRLGLRHLLRHERPRRRAWRRSSIAAPRGAARASRCPSSTGLADWMTVPLLQFEGTGREPAAHRPGSSLDLPLRRLRHQGRFPGAHLHPERARMGGPSPRTSWTSPTCRGATASASTTSASPTARWSMRTSDACSPPSRATNAPPSSVAPTPPTASSTTAPGCAAIPALRRVTVDTPEGPVAIGAPPARLSDGARGPRSGAVPRLAWRRVTRRIRRMRAATFKHGLRSVKPACAMPGRAFAWGANPRDPPYRIDTPESGRHPTSIASCCTSRSTAV